MYIPDHSYDNAIRYGWWRPGDGPRDIDAIDPNHLCAAWTNEQTLSRRCRRPSNDGHTAHNAGTGVTWWNDTGD